MDPTWDDTPQAIEQPPKGFKTGLYDKTMNSPDKPSVHTDVENLLTDFEKTVGSQIRSKILYKDTRKISDFDKNLLEIIANLRKEKDWVLVPSDKKGT